MGNNVLANLLMGLSRVDSPFRALYFYLIQITIYASVTAVAIILFKLVFQNRLRARWHFLVWAILLVRVAFPILPASSASVFNAARFDNKAAVSVSSSTSVEKKAKAEETEEIENTDNKKVEIRSESGESKTERIEREKPIQSGDNSSVEKTEPGAETTAQTAAEPPSKAPKQVEVKQAIAVDGVIVFTWLGGAAILMCVFGAAMIVFTLRLRKTRRNCDEIIPAIFDECRKELNIKRNVSLYYANTPPMLTGLFKPSVYIPETLSHEELRVTLLHELNHLKHLDVLWTMFAAFVLCLNWFNPIIWLCFFMLKRDVEVYCDERTVSLFESKQDYARLLLKIATEGKSKFVLGTTSLQSGKSDVERRIKYMAKFRKPTPLLTAAAIALVAVILVGCLTNSKNTDSGSKLKSSASQSESATEQTASTSAAATEKPTAAPKQTKPTKAKSEETNTAENKIEDSEFVALSLKTTAVQYDFTLLRNKKLSVKKTVADRNSEKTVTISDSQYSAITKAADGIHSFIRDDGVWWSENPYTYSVKIDGEIFGRHEVGGATRAGYDYLLESLIKASPIDVVDGKGAKITIRNEDNWYLDDEGKNPNIDFDYDPSTQTLTFTGSGKIKDYSYYTPWYDVDMPVHVVIEDGITRLCADMCTGGIDGNSGTPRYDFAHTKSVSIPDSVTEIAYDAFYQCRDLESITLPKNLQSIGSMAFSGCKSLKKVTLPQSLTEISDSLFSECDSLEEVVFGDKTRVIEGCAFQSNESLKKVILPKSLKRIGYSAFGYCPSLKKIEIPEGVTAIGEDAFFGTGLKSVTIPSSVTKIGKGAFGFRWIEDEDRIVASKGFTIYGYKNTAAEKYASRYGFKFVEVEE